MDFLYNIFIMPLIYMLEIVVYILHPVLSLNSICAVFIISFIVNFISYPIFAKIEQMIKADNEKYQKLLPKITSIKRNFSGQEKRMLLATFFRQTGYHPIFAHFKQSLTIFLQVPIFIASYIVICENSLFQNPILDQINNYLTFFNIPVKILPILMTIINVVSVRIYMQNKSLSGKIYANSLSILFFILLYFSPASIVLYWIFNNSFALLRNVWIYQKKYFCAILSVYMLCVISLALFVNFHINTIYSFIIIILGLISFKLIKYIIKDPLYLMSFVLFLIISIALYTTGYVDHTPVPMPLTTLLLILYLGGIFYKYYMKNIILAPTILDCAMVLLVLVSIIGLYLPIKIINSDPSEFYAVVDLFSLMKYEFVLSLGVFFVYPIIVFILLKKYRSVIYLVYLVSMLLFLFEICTFEQPRDVLGLSMRFEITNSFKYGNNDIVFMLIYTMCIIMASSIVIKHRYMKYLNTILFAIVVCYGLNTLNEFVKIKKSIGIYVKNSENWQYSYKISKNGNNVVILFIDKAVSAFLPYIMQEKRELSEIYSGFMYYPRTLSFSAHTIYSTPSMLGGYEYTPQKLQKDTTKKMVEKHNESISVLPEIFRKNGYNVTIFDLPSINYGDITKPGIFHKDINYISLEGAVTTFDEKLEKLIKRNMFFFLLFRIVPKIYKDGIYSEGRYMVVDTGMPIYIRTESNIPNNYEILKQFTENFNIIDDDSNNFIIFRTLLPHSRGYMTKEYTIPKEESEVWRDNIYFEEDIAKKDYAVNMATYIKLSEWIKKLKENDAYDNTRIIIASDHADYFSIFKNIKPIITGNNAVLMVKDFNAKDMFSVSHDFMTLADIPTISLKDIIENPINPFTGKQIINTEKEYGVDIITTLFKKRSPTQYEDEDRTYLYDEEVEYMHIDKNSIKELIKIKKGL